MVVKHESSMGGRKAYSTPTLRVWGKVAKLTAGPTGLCSDGDSGSSGNQSCT